MSHRSRLTGFLLTSAALIGLAAPASAVQTDRVIVLTGATSAEGIAAGPGGKFYAGVLYGGDIYQGSIFSSSVTKWIDVPEDRNSAGMALDAANNLLYVAGGPGRAYVYNVTTRAEVARYDLADPRGSLVNDVTLTPDGAWFTDSFQPKLYFIPIVNGRPGAARTLTVTGPAAAVVPGGQINLNGIRAHSSGCPLIVSHSQLGKLFTVDAVTGSSTQIAGADVPMVDGLAFDGVRLWAAQLWEDKISRFRLSSDLSQATLETEIFNPDFDIPSAVAVFGSRIAVVNSHFPPDGGPSPDKQYEVVVTDS